MSKRKFTWDSWNYDCNGDAYIIAQDLCPDVGNVPEWIAIKDHLDPQNIPKDIRQGFCKFQCRSDWEDTTGPHGFYVVTEWVGDIKNLYGKKKAGWFPVWIIRKEEENDENATYSDCKY